MKHEKSDTFMTATEVAGLLRISRQHLWRLRRSCPDFPQPLVVGLGVGTLRWERDSVFAYLSSRPRRNLAAVPEAA